MKVTADKRDATLDGVSEVMGDENDSWLGKVCNSLCDTQILAVKKAEKCRKNEPTACKNTVAKT